MRLFALLIAASKFSVCLRVVVVRSHKSATIEMSVPELEHRPIRASGALEILASIFTGLHATLHPPPPLPLIFSRPGISGSLSRAELSRHFFSRSAELERWGRCPRAAPAAIDIDVGALQQDLQALFFRHADTSILIVFVLRSSHATPSHRHARSDGRALHTGCLHFLALLPLPRYPQPPHPSRPSTATNSAIIMHSTLVPRQVRPVSVSNIATNSRLPAAPLARFNPRTLVPDSTPLPTL